ncbi:MAG: metal ABC transporter permease [Candidatus Margulisiibacteriota bacterium]
MLASIEIMLIGCLVATAAAIPGCFLILRGMAMMSDAISHSVLLGIVIMFFIVKTLHSPLLIIAAAITGLITVALTERLIASKQMKKDAAIGLIFPLFFAIAIILISQFAGNIHLDQDAVILGEIAFAPFNRWIIGNIDLGPMGLWIMGSITLLNIGFITLFFKELKLSTFDSQLAKSLGLSPLLLHYGLMSCVSITCVGAFDIVGTILIVALIITPPASAYLLTSNLNKMIWISVFIGCSCAILGTLLAIGIDGSISGSMCSIAGIIFILVFLFAPNHGIIKKFYNQKRQKLQFSAILLTVQFLNHQAPNQNPFEYSMMNLIDHMQWSSSFAEKVISHALEKNYIQYSSPHYRLTDYGIEVAKNAMASS